MADTKLSALTELAATPADDDEVYIRDVSELASAESKRITITNLAATADAKITTHETGGKHRWTANKVLLGAGAGSNPTEVDPGVDWSAKTPVADDAEQAAATLAASTYYNAISVTAAGYLTSVGWRHNAVGTSPNNFIRETLKIDGAEIFRSVKGLIDNLYARGYDGTNILYEIAFALLHRFDTSFQLGCYNTSASAREKGVRLVSCAYVLD